MAVLSLVVCRSLLWLSLVLAKGIGKYCNWLAMFLVEVL